MAIRNITPSLVWRQLWLRISNLNLRPFQIDELGLTKSILAIGELLFLAQAILGMVMYVNGGRPARLIHYLYGILMMILIPATFAFTGGKTTRSEALIYGLMALFMAAMAATRAMTTG